MPVPSTHSHMYYSTCSDNVGVVVVATANPTNHLSQHLDIHMRVP